MMTSDERLTEFERGFYKLGIGATALALFAGGAFFGKVNATRELQKTMRAEMADVAAQSLRGCVEIDPQNGGFAGPTCILASGKMIPPPPDVWLTVSPPSKIPIPARPPVARESDESPDSAAIDIPPEPPGQPPPGNHQISVPRPMPAPPCEVGDPPGCKPIVSPEAPNPDMPSESPPR
jgi:hypothetical protein